MRERKIKFKKDRIHYALDKKLLKSLGWRDEDKVDQITFGYDRILLFNKSQNDRIATELKGLKIKKEFLDLIGEQDFQRQKEWREFREKNKRRKKFSPKSREYKRNLKKFNYGKIYEEDLTKIQRAFNIQAINKGIRNLLRLKRSAKRNFNKLIRLIEQDPLKAIKQVEHASIKREETFNNEIKEKEKQLKLLRKRSKKRVSQHNFFF